MSHQDTLDRAVAELEMATTVNPDYAIERLKRARWKTEPEYKEILRPVDPATLKPSKLTRNEQSLVDEVIAIAFAPRQ